MDIRKEKRQLRSELNQRAASLSIEYCCEADKKITSYVQSLEAYRRGKVLFCFVGTEREIDTKAILEDALRRGKQVAVPRCIARGIMEAQVIKSLKELTLGHYGILEPPKESPVVLPGNIDLALIPCLSCTKDGRRIGYGGGYYDRYLEQVEGVKAVLCRGQLMCDHIPVEFHDKKMDFVISEKGVIFA